MSDGTLFGDLRSLVQRLPTNAETTYRDAVELHRILSKLPDYIVKEQAAPYLIDVCKQRNHDLNLIRTDLDNLDDWVIPYSKRIAMRQPTFEDGVNLMALIESMMKHRVRELDFELDYTPRGIRPATSNTSSHSSFGMATELSMLRALRGFSSLITTVDLLRVSVSPESVNTMHEAVRLLGVLCERIPEQRGSRPAIKLVLCVSKETEQLYKADDMFSLWPQSTVFDVQAKCETDYVLRR
jgi:hypothetical protein